MKIARVIIERVTITGPADEQPSALLWCYDRGYRVVRSGPPRLQSNQADLARYEIVAERETHHEEVARARVFEQTTEGPEAERSPASATTR